MKKILILMNKIIRHSNIVRGGITLLLLLFLVAYMLVIALKGFELIDIAWGIILLPVILLGICLALLSIIVVTITLILTKNMK